MHMKLWDVRIANHGNLMLTLFFRIIPSSVPFGLITWRIIIIVIALWFTHHCTQQPIKVVVGYHDTRGCDYSVSYIVYCRPPSSSLILVYIHWFTVEETSFPIYIGYCRDRGKPKFKQNNTFIRDQFPEKIMSSWQNFDSNYPTGPQIDIFSDSSYARSYDLIWSLFPHSQDDLLRNLDYELRNCSQNA